MHKTTSTRRTALGPLTFYFRERQAKWGGTSSSTQPVLSRQIPSDRLRAKAMMKRREERMP